MDVAQHTDAQAARALLALVVGISDVGHAVGVGDAADRQVADDYRLAVFFTGTADAAGFRVDADAVQLGELIFLVSRRGVRVRVVPRAALVVVGGIFGLIVHQPLGRGGIRGASAAALVVSAHRRVGFGIDVGPGVFDLMVFVPAGEADGHQLVADHLPDHRVAVRAGDGFRLGGGHKAVDHVALAVHQVVVGAELEVAHPGEVQGLEILRREIGVIDFGVCAVFHILGPHQEKAVANQRAVHGVAGVVAGGGHVQVNAAHHRAIAQLGGVHTAHAGGAVGPGGVHAVHAVPEDGPLLFIALGVDVCHVVADNGQLLHMGLQARDGCVH